MIRTFDICINAAHPEVKLYEAATFISSPSTAFVRGVPPAMGSWRITAVRLAAAWPDGSIENTTATQTGDGVWAATLQGMDASGRVENGLQVLADGVDETGAAVTGYVLGIADLAVYTRDATIDVDGQSWYVKLFESAPTPPHKGDAYISSGYLLIYDGEQWIIIGGGGGGGGIVDDTVTRASSNAVKSSGIWSAIWGTLTALPTGFAALYDWVAAQLVGKLSTSGGTMTGEITMSRGNAVVFGDTDGPAVYSSDGTTLKADTRGTTGVVALLSDIPTVPTASTDAPLADGTASSGASAAYARGDHRHPTDTSRQATITASGILKGNGSGGVTAATAGTDYQAPLTIDATPTASSTNPVQSGGVKTALDGRLSTTGDTRTVTATATDSGGTETYKFAGTGDTDANTVVRVKNLPYINEGESEEMLVDVYAIFSRGVQRHTATSGETSATFGFADTPGSGRILDAILDIDNSANASELGLEFNGLGTVFALGVDSTDVSASKTAGEVLAEMTTVEANTRARFYLTETAQTVTVGSTTLPVISIQRLSIATAIVRGGAA